MTLRLKMIHHHTKFGQKKLNGSEDCYFLDKARAYGQTDAVMPVYPSNSVTWSI